MGKDILILKEKYGESYLDISTPELRARAFIEILRERMDSGHYYFKPTQEEPRLSEDDLTYQALSEEEVQKLPHPIRIVAMEKRARVAGMIKASKNEHQEELLWWNAATEVLALPLEEALLRGKLNRRSVFISQAEELLEERRDHQYEGYELEELIEK